MDPFRVRFHFVSRSCATPDVMMGMDAAAGVLSDSSMHIFTGQNIVIDACPHLKPSCFTFVFSTSHTRSLSRQDLL